MNCIYHVGISFVLEAPNNRSRCSKVSDRTLRPPWPTFGSVRFKMTSGAMGAKVKFGFCAVTLNLDPPIKYVPPGMNISKQPRGYNSAVSIRFGSVEIIVKTTLLN